MAPGSMRVIPNLYPAFDGDEPFAVHHRGPVHVEAEASGTHEVFVLTRDHDCGPSTTSATPTPPR